MADRLFTVEALVESLTSCCGDESSDYLLAYSGGLDSTVLLHALAVARDSTALPHFKLTVVHVNHGLHSAAADWQAHCEQVCQNLGLSCRVEVIETQPPAGESIEAWARQARYAALAKHCSEKTLLLTAHHRDDQAETLMLNLLRSSGPQGLAAIPVLRTLDGEHAATRVCRPLLTFSRQVLKDYAQQQGLRWVDDPSNQDDTYDRNYLRLNVLPLLEQRWPAYASSLGRVAGIQSEVVALLDEIAMQDLSNVVKPSGLACSIAGLQELSRKRQENLLRYWFRKNGFYPPGHRQMKVLLEQVIAASSDAQPQLRVGQVLLRRYRDSLTMQLAPPPAVQAPSCTWNLSRELDIAVGILRAERITAGGIDAGRISGDSVEVRFRQGGERCRPAGRQGSHPLKKILQELEIPVWLRGQVPLIYIGDELVAVADYFVCEGFQARAGEMGWCIQWLRRCEDE